MKNPTKTLNIARNYQNKARLWIEQALLNTECGFQKGDKVAIDYKPDSIVITKDINGIKSISGRTRNNRFIPILEVSNQLITEWCGVNDCYRVELTFQTDKVVIKPAEPIK